MYCTRKITGDITWVGGFDRRKDLFEAVYPIPQGVSYNSYLLKSEGVNILFDTVDEAVSSVFFENIEHLLSGEELHYLVVHHLEPDHSATIKLLTEKYPIIKIICSAKTAGMLSQFAEISNEVITVNEGETFKAGGHELTFIMAPMVHWPEVMMTFDSTEGVLFSADAFGHFGTFSGEIFAGNVDFSREFMDEARRYYCNIVGKYGVQVQNVLKKASALPIKYICPLHGLVWNGGFEEIVEKYNKWSSYTPEEDGVLIVYGSIYGGTANAANIIAGILSEKGIKNEVFDAAVTHRSYLLGKAFQYSRLIIASATYNNGIFTPVEIFLNDLVSHGWKNRRVGIIENGSWAPAAAKCVKLALEGCKDLSFTETTVTLKTKLKKEQLSDINKLAEEI